MALQSSSPELQLEQRDRIVILGFNRPARKNALSLAMYAAAADALRQADEEADVRVIVITAVGDDFTSGNDLRDFMNDPKIHDDHPVVRFMRALQHARKPIIAAVRGSAIGIGTTMLLHCDLVYLADNARLQLPFVNLGLSPEYAASFLLPALLGHPKASELLLLGEPFSAAQALNLHLANEVVADAELDAVVFDKAQRLAQQPPAAVRRTKALLKRSQQTAIDTAIAAEFSVFTEGLASAECREAMTAFLEKRAANFSQF